MHKYPKVCLSALPNFHTELGSSRCLQNILTTITCAAFGVAITVWTVGSLTQKTEWASQIELINQRQPSLSDTAVPTPRTFSVGTAATRHSSTKDSCDDFVYSFLNSTCSKIRKKHAVRVSHHVATLVIGHPDARSIAVP